MPLQTRDAIVILDRMVERSLENLRAPEIRTYGNARLTVVAGESEPLYWFGFNQVDRANAVNVLKTFEQPSR